MDSMKNGPNLNFKLIIVQYLGRSFSYLWQKWQKFLYYNYIYLINRTSIKMLNKNVTFL